MVVYLKLMEVWGRENSGWVLLWLISAIKALVTVSYVMTECQTDVFSSVFCDARESMDFLHNWGIATWQCCVIVFPRNTSFLPLFLSFFHHFTVTPCFRRICLLNTYLQYFSTCIWVYVWKYVGKPYVFNRKYEITCIVLYIYTINRKLAK